MSAIFQIGDAQLMSQIRMADNKVLINNVIYGN